MAEAAALERCEELRDFYKATQGRARRWYHFFKIIALASTVFAPVVVLVYPTDTYESKIVVALVAAIGGMCTGVLSVFNWHEVWIRHAQAADEFESQRVLFLDHAGQYANARDATARFAEKVESIQRDVLARWVKKEDEAFVDKHLRAPQLDAPQRAAAGPGD